MSVIINIVLVIIGVLLFGFVIFFHELGHFLAARLCQIKVNEFSIGMGPKIFSKQKGETLYSLRAFPIGGFCAMEGEDEESDDKHAFGSRPVWQRMIVIVAGGFMNIVLGIIISVIIFSTQDVFATTQIAKLPTNPSMANAGIETGDTITRIDDYAVYSDKDFLFGIQTAEPDSMDIEVLRDGKKITFKDVDISGDDDADGKKTIDIAGLVVYPMEKTVISTLKKSAIETYSMVRMVIVSLKGLISGRYGLNEMAGPLGTAQVISEAASAGLQTGFGDAVLNILTIIVLITVNLGVVNLLPLPALDGGRFLFLLFELIFRKPVPAKYEGMVHTVGFVLLIGLMLVVTFNDVIRLVTG